MMKERNNNNNKINKKHKSSIKNKLIEYLEELK